MVVVVVTAAGAILLLRAYNGLPEHIEPITVIERIQQSTAVLAALCAATFTIIAALRTGKPPGFSGLASSSSLPASHAAPSFGRPAGLSGSSS